MWELSPLYRHSTTENSIFSPTSSTSTTSSRDANYLISSQSERLILRNPITLEILKTWKLSSNPTTTTSKPSPPIASSSKLPESSISSISVSSNSARHILAFSIKSNQAWILDPTLDEPVAKIEVGAEGAVAMTWSGSGDTVLVWSAHHFRLSLYRIASPSPALHILNPKLAYPFGFSFRPKDSRYLALAERHTGRDHIGIYDCVTWKLLRHFPLPTTTADIADVDWSPCGRYIAVWESLTDYILHLYTPDGRHLSTFTPYARLDHIIPTSSNSKASRLNPTSISASPTAEINEKEKKREERSTKSWVGLGIRTVKWHPSGDWIAVGGWDGKIRILTRLAWVPVAELNHPLKVSVGTLVWHEPKDWIEKTRGKGIIPFESQPLPYTPPFVRADLNRPNPKMGISLLSWSPSGRWLASYNQSYPTTIWIFAFLSSVPSSSSSPASTTSTPHFTPKLHSILVHNSSIKNLQWQPTDSISIETLAIVTGEKCFITWREPIIGSTNVAVKEGEERGEELDGIAEGVGIPARTDFNPTTLTFSERGDALILADKETFTVAYPVIEDEEGLSRSEIGERTWIEGE